MPDDVKVVDFRRPDLGWARFVLARHEMNLAFQTWIEEREPDDADVQEEIDATSSVLIQLRDMLTR